MINSIQSTRVSHFQVYRWEKRDFNDIKHVLKPQPLPMPPPYRDGLILEFDAPLNPKRHDLNVLCVYIVLLPLVVLPCSTLILSFLPLNYLKPNT